MIRDILFHHGDDPRALGRLHQWQRDALEDIAACGTEACGLHRETCDQCGEKRYVANTCSNRNCPHCQGGARAKWVAARERELLPGIGYFHAVFTLPSELAALARACPSVVLDCQLKASADAILHLCRDRRHLGAEVGIVEVLHTWTRDLRWHPHVHQIVTAGGWDGTRWVDARRYGKQGREFLLPAAVLIVAYQQRLRRLLLRRYDDFDPALAAAFPCLATRKAFAGFLNTQMQQRWCLRIEPPFASAGVLLRYLGAYVNRVAIAPSRIVAHDPTANDGLGSVTWRWCPASKPGQWQTRTTTGVDFVQRFAQHILPPRLVRIRFRGLWATAHRRTKLDAARDWLRRRRPAAPESKPAPRPTPGDRTCPNCGGTFVRSPGPNPRPPRGERRRTLVRLRSWVRAAGAGATPDAAMTATM